MKLDKNIEHIGKQLDDKIDSKIKAALAEAEKLAVEDIFSKKDLDTMINDDETLREFILDGISEFHLEPVDLDNLTDEELNTLVAKIDDLWRMI